MSLPAARGALLIAILSALLLGCGASPRKPEPQRKRVVIRMWLAAVMPDLIDRHLYGELQREFMRENPDIEVKVEFIPTARRLQSMITASAGNRAPDAAGLPLDYLPRFVQLKMLRPVDDLITEELRKDYDPAVLEAVQLDGQTWSFPSWRAAVAGLYNKDLFAEAGFDPEKPPLTWDELKSVAKTLTKDRNGDGVTDQWGLAFGYGGETLNASFWPMLWQAGGEILTPDEKRVAFDSPAGLDALRFVVGLYQNEWVPPSYLGISGNAASTEFAEGKIGYWWGANQTIPWKLRRDVPDLNFGYGPILERQRRVSFSSLGTYGIFAQCKYPKETAQWILFLNRPDNMRRICDTLNVQPTRASLTDIHEDDPVVSHFEDEAHLCRSDLKHIHARRIMALLIPEIQLAASGRKSPEQALGDAAEKCNHLLETGK